MDTAQTLYQRFSETAALYPSHSAYLDREEVVTYGMLQEKINALTKGFISIGIRKGDRVGIWLPNFTQWIVTELALAGIGAMIVPINARFKKDEVRYVLKLADISTLIMTDTFLTNNYLQIIKELLPELDHGNHATVMNEEFPYLRQVILVDSRPQKNTLSYREVLEMGKSVSVSLVNNMREQVHPDDPLFVFWTSGTTGFPKGVIHNHRACENILNFAEFIGLSQEDRVLANKPWFYIAGNFWTLLMPLLRGSFIIPTMTFKAEEILNAIQRWSVTTILATPQQFKTLTETYEREKIWKIDSLVKGVMGGASPSEALIKRIRLCFSVPELIQIYGMTETQGYSMVTPKGLADDILSVSVGKPLPGFECKIVNPENGTEVPLGTPGELWIRGRVLVGYYKKLWKETFETGGWFRTGDLFIQDENGFRVVGRIKDVIKVGGENVAAEEVERILMTHPNVRQAAVFGIPDSLRGEVCVAFLEWKDPSMEEDLSSWCKERMAPFKIPRFFRRIRSNAEWPMTESSKIKKSVLRQSFIEEGTKNDQ